MYHEYTQGQLRSYCRTNIETLEIWARRLINEQMNAEFGNDYFNQKINDEFLVKKDIRKHINNMMKAQPDRFKNPVDTLFIEQIIYFLCNEKWYKKLFKPALDYVYPQGKDEAREFLNRLVPIRNPLSHSNPITMHDVERAICYSHDFIEGLKKYYKNKGEEQVWNVPRIIKIRDSLGNVFENPIDKNTMNSIFTVKNEMHCGEVYSVEIEIDPSYTKDQYDIIWLNNQSQEIEEFKNAEKYTIKFEVTDISELHIIRCKIIQKKPWHKYTFYDCEISLHLTVLPPIE